MIHVSYDPTTLKNAITEYKRNTDSNNGKKGGTRKTGAKGETDSSMVSQV